MNLAPYDRIHGCRSCGGRVESVWEMGAVPIADRLVRPGDAEARELGAPLTLGVCPDCGLVQLFETVPPGVLYGDGYPYHTSVSPALVAHFHGSAARLIAGLDLRPGDRVLEIASNDGTLLEPFAAAGLEVLGVDPAEGPVRAARERGIPTRLGYFGRAMAGGLGGEFPGGFRLVLANNVLAHASDLNGFVAGLAGVLAPGGRAVIEVPYLADLIDGCEFDTIYHQHLCYFSVGALGRLLERHGLAWIDLERTPIHGGSLRLHVARKDDAPSVRPAAVNALLREESVRGLGAPDTLRAFAGRAMAVAGQVRERVREERAAGRRVVAYGAAAKATTLLALTGLGVDDLEYAADRNVLKHGWCMPGSRLPVVAPARLIEDRPDTVLLLAWNFASEVVAQMPEHTRNGGRWLVPLPKPRVLEADAR